MKKKRLKIIAIVLGGMVIIVALLHTPPVRRFVLKYLLAQIEGATGAHAQATSLQYNLLNWTFTLKDFKLTKKNHPTFLEIKSLRINIPFPPSMKETIHLQHLEITHPVIHYQVNADGTDNIPFSPADPASAPASDPVDTPPDGAIPPFIIENMTITDARVVYHDRKSNTTADIAGIRATLGRRNGYRHALSMEIVTGAVKAADPKGISNRIRVADLVIPLERFRLDAQLDHRDMDIKTFLVRSGQNQLEMHGTLTGYGSDTPVANLNLGLHLVTADAVPLFPQLAEGVTKPGTLSMTAHLEGPVDHPKMEIRVGARGFRLDRPVATTVSGSGTFHLEGFTMTGLKGKGSFQFRQPTDTTPEKKPGKTGPRLHGELDFATTADGLDLAVHRLETAGTGTTGRISGGPGRINGELAIEIPGIKEMIRQSAVLTGWDPETMPIDGHCSARVAIKGKPGNPRISVSGNARLLMEDLPTTEVGATVDYFEDRLDFSTLDIKTDSPALQIRGPLKLVLGEGMVRVEKMEMTGPGLRLKAAGDVIYETPPPGPAKSFVDRGRQPFGFDVAVETDLLQRLFPDYELAGHVELEGRMLGTLEQPVLDARLDITGGRVLVPAMTGAVEDINVRIKAGDNKVDIHSLSFEWGGLRFVQPEPARLEKDDRNGILTLDRLVLRTRGSQSEDSFLEMGGSLGLNPPHAIQAQVKGGIDSSILQPFTEDIVFSGGSDFDFALTGDLDAPRYSGAITIRDLGVRHLEYPLVITGLKGKAVLSDDGGLATPAPIKGHFNGGPLEIRIKESLEFSFREANMDIPAGLYTRAAGTLTLTVKKSETTISETTSATTSTVQRYLLQGDVTFSGGRYEENFSLGSQLFRFFSQRAAPAAEIMENGTQAPFPLDLDINLYAEKPVEIENNIAMARLTASLRLKGPYYNPSVSGRAQVQEGGEIYLGKHTYYIDRGLVHFINPYVIEPELDIIARTRVGAHDINLGISGTPGGLSVTLTSTPPLPESHIIALLVSGKPMENTDPSSMDNSGSKVLSYLSAALSGTLGRGLQRVLGLETVRIDGMLAASEEDPGARITVGHHLAPNLELILSQGLSGARDRSWIIDFTPFPGLNLRGNLHDESLYELGVSHLLRFGPRPPSGTASPESTQKKRPARQKISAVTIRGVPVFSRGDILKQLGLKPGKRFHFFRFRGGLKKLRKYYARHHYLNARVNGRKEGSNGEGPNGSVELILDINAGPRVHLEYRGASLPRGIQKKARQEWLKGHFDQQRINAVREMLRHYFFKKKYYTADVVADVSLLGQDSRRVVFTIKPGPRFGGLSIEFPGEYSGVRHISAAQVTQLLKKNGLLPLLLIRPVQVVRFLRQWYRARGYPDVDIDTPRTSWVPGATLLTIAVPVEEGARYRVGSVTSPGAVEGLDINHDINHTIGIKTGDYYDLDVARAAATSLESRYHRAGYHGTRVILEPIPQKEEHRIDLRYRIELESRRRIRAIHIKGNYLTRDKTIRRELLFRVGQILDLKAFNKSRKQLYDLGIFRRVTLNIVPSSVPEAQSSLNKSFTGSRGGFSKEPLAAGGAHTVWCDIEVEVLEQKPYRLRYGLQFDSGRSLGVTGELLNLNVFGGASLLGGGFDWNRLRRNVILFGRVPHFPRRKTTAELFLFNRREQITPGGPLVERTGLTLQERWRPGKGWKSLWNIFLSYTIERYNAERGITLGHITASTVYDSRDSLIDARRGLFFSQGLQYAGKLLFSHRQFWRAFWQLNYYRPFGAGGLVWAGSVHAGIGRGLGQELLPGERFFAGGSATIRGFRYNGVGPLDPEKGFALGGEGLFILRQELRIPLFPETAGVLFLDMGNIYRTLSSYNPFKLRTGIGIGLRRSLAGLMLRLDWGINLNRRPGESRSHIYLSLGQAF